MEGVFMNEKYGKVLKVVEYNLTFGSSSRLVNVFGCFKYKPNNGLYLLYADVDTKYNVIYYGSSHVKERAILSMSCKEQKDEEIIKEYIFKTTNGETLDNFEMISLVQIDGVEIISSNKLEVKPEVLATLVDATIFKPEVKEEEVGKKKSSKKFLLLLIIGILVVGVGYFFVSTSAPKESSIKNIACTKKYDHKTLNSTVDEARTYIFNYQDVLETIDATTTYQFHTQEDYEEFINKGTYYKYMPEDDTEGGWDKDDTKYTFKIITKERIDSSYRKPTGYEEVLASLKKEGYTCTENLEKES